MRWHIETTMSSRVFLPNIPQPFTRTDAEAFVTLNMSESWARSPTFAVVLDGRLIGTVNFEVEAR